MAVDDIVEKEKVLLSLPLEHTFGTFNILHAREISKSHAGANFNYFYFKLQCQVTTENLNKN